MHRIAATPGGWNPDSEGVIFIEQTPAPIAILTAADTDIQTLVATIPHLPSNFPQIRAVNLLQLQQQLSIDAYGESILERAKIVILRLLGGKSYWSYGLEVVEEIAKNTGAFLFILPGDNRPDLSLMSHSTVPLTAVDRLWQYFIEGGVDNYLNALKFVASFCLNLEYNYFKAISVPRVGLYGQLATQKHSSQKVGILFYRAHYLAGNIRPIDALCQALKERNLESIPVFLSSLRDRDVQNKLLSYFQPQDESPIQILLNTTSFSLAKIGSEAQSDLWKKLDVPVLQVILSGGTEEQWEESFQGLTPRDVAMNVALPEVDGKVITRAISFKSVETWNEDLETDVVVYQPKGDRIDFIADLAKNWVHLKQTPVQERKIALILANYPNKDGRIANGVGLDTPQSCIEILKALQQQGYFVEDIPATGDELIFRLTANITNDLEANELRESRQLLSYKKYQQYFSSLPQNIQQGMSDRWHIPNSNSSFPIPGIQFGNIFVGIQPSRGYDLDPSLNYHAPDLEPTHNYLAFYYWLREEFPAHAIAHIGKHGNLEWLPGKSIALSSECYPEIALGTLPHFYPFIINDPGEGSQAKRRGHAIILDHLTPPLTRAELYGSLQQLEALIDEYYEAQTLNPSRLPLLGEKITQLVTTENLDRDLGIETIETDAIAEFLTLADGYLCELKEAQIRNGLHIFGQCPQDEQLRDLIIAISRSPSSDRIGLTRAIAEDLNLDFDPLTADLSQFINSKLVGDLVEELEEKASYLIENLLEYKINNLDIGEHTRKELAWIQNILLPNLYQTQQEIDYLMKGFNGQHIPSGASGAPTRGRPEVLPTGRNFYSVDIRAIPTETAWDVGRKAAETVVERYTQENGEYPQTLAISVWGTSTMRTGGDDIAEVLALLGVQPIWDGLSRRVVDFEVLPLSILGRPRVDVTLRISGFFRDGFPNLISLVYNAIATVSQLDESPEQNPLAAKVKQETIFWQQQGIKVEKANLRALERIFGSKPGAYGAGLQGLIESQNWHNDEDLARAYLNWSSYAYSPTENGTIQGVSSPESFARCLQNLQIVLHNQDNREHDLLDSDDYYQFQGGLTAAVRSLKGKNPVTYFGDNSIPANPRTRQLKEEIARVYRSRVVNPKWIAGVMRHGYKGAFEMAATVDYLFAYDATANCVEDFMYQGIADTYLFAENVQEFIQEKNPWALRDISERLLEAHQRGLWRSPSQQTLDALKMLANQAEGIIEEN
ncbi:MAG: cobaltochelatase subunit CobN [Cyanobacteria bacterium SBLK]|nr:cobaltochelatase subunit CobN [Cyanobacteria bacterium SBLK]